MEKSVFGFVVMVALSAANCASQERFVLRNAPIKAGEFSVTIEDYHIVENEGSLRVPYLSCHVKNVSGKPLRLLSFEVCADSDCMPHPQRNDILLPEQDARIMQCFELPYRNESGAKITVRALSEPINGKLNSGSGVGESKRQRIER